ncbi:sterile alpha motif domain-containing protein 3 [Sphaeramia orbicularis]|uniref:sterile alpha motif domain-containing protein 3 n=1 Tax=Sphaeramia orbicularis TaxID=375764 RepID=UPI00118089BF|nr:sterile alpha motif domain-containing protein 3 [Sphaeramia orbicularis]XP_030007098.1 sterile alpha motif domain-containing protein 3 [Sphaeramia orbicularis]
MSTQAKLRVILQDHEIRKLDLPHGIPNTVDELESIVREKFGLEGNFTLHYKDADFGEEYFSLTSTNDIKDKDTIKVVHIVEPPTVTLTFTDGDSSFESASVASLPNSETSIHPASSSCSSGSQDTLILSSPEYVTHRTQRWPTTFPVPNFAYDTELVLASGNEDFKRDGIQLNFVTVLSDILEKLAESIFLYVAYPTSAQLNDVAEALIQKHPCLKEPGSHNGCYAWQQRLKYKMASYRSKLRGLGCPELDVNSLRKKRAHEKAPAKNIKKPKRAEVNYLPPHPQGETEGTLEHVRLELLDEVKKRNNCQVISEKMAKTFSIRRQEVVNQAPPISDLRDRWPALFDATQINEEFRRVTTVVLETTFMAKLDQYTLKIMALVSSRGGAAKMKIQHIKNMLLEEQTVERRREAAIRCLIVYMREQEEDLFKEQLDGDEVMKIVVSRGASEPANATVVIEGAEVLDGLTVPRACALLMGLIYALNLSYPKELKCTFEVFQKIFLELDALRASPKVMSLKGKLLH